MLSTLAGQHGYIFFESWNLERNLLNARDSGILWHSVRVFSRMIRSIEFSESVAFHCL
jgi:hypothetical protein